jgi:hypothetical protein
VTMYVCRAHPDEPVSWRGTGCAACAAEHRAVLRWQDRQRRRLDRRPEPEYPIGGAA